MLYHPANRFVYDTWYTNHGNLAHLFYVQMRRPGVDFPDAEEGSVGHAVSDDLLHWREQPIAVLRGPEGSCDGGGHIIFTGCAVSHAEQLCLYYGAIHSQSGRYAQHTGMYLATSQDGVTFVKHPMNPVLCPDPRFYYTADDPLPPHQYHTRGMEDCRDTVIVPEPSGAGWLGYTVMRRKVESQYESCCVSLYRSPDLIHWEAGPPCCVPNRFTTAEVPDVFQIGDRWYLTLLTADGYGQRNRFPDPYISQMTIVFESDSPYGPFTEVRDNFLLANSCDQGYSVRTLDWRGERLMFYSRVEYAQRKPTMSRVSWPVRVVPRPGGGLLPMYWLGIEAAFGKPIVTPVQSLEVHAGWRIQSLAALPDRDATGMLTAEISLQNAPAAGLSIRRQGTHDYAPGCLVLLDAVRGEVQLLAVPRFDILMRRTWPLSPGGRYRLRVVFVGEFVEVYVDDVLALNAFLEMPVSGGMGLYVDDGTALFNNMTYWSGCCGKNEYC